MGRDCRLSERESNLIKKGQKDTRAHATCFCTVHANERDKSKATKPEKSKNVYKKVGT